MVKQFIQDARSFYSYRLGSRELDKAQNFSKDPLEVYKEVLNKSVMETIFDSAKNDYELDLSKFEILQLFLFHGERRFLSYSRVAKERTKFRQPKGDKIPKKEKTLAQKKYNDRGNNPHWRSRSNSSWSKRQRAKSHRQWVKRALFLLDKDIDRFSSGDEEYKYRTDPWWY